MQLQIETREQSAATRWQLKSALKLIDPSHLEGLDRIRVIEACPIDPQAHQVEPYLRGFLYNGRYDYISTLNGGGGVTGEIVLYRTDIHFGIPTIFMFTPAAVLKVARHLGHEIGHHLMTRQSRPTMRYKAITNAPNRRSEDLADDYADHVVDHMLSHRVYRVANRFNILVSNLYYRAGLQDYHEEDFQSSAKRFFFAYIMNLAHVKAGNAYRHAMEKLRVQSPSPLSEAEQYWLDTYYNPFPDKTGTPKRRKRRK